MLRRKIFQVAPFGGKTPWIELAFNEFPELDGLLLLVNKTEQNADYVKEAEEMIKGWREKNEKLPPPKKKEYWGLFLENGKALEFYRLVYIFRSVFSEMDEMGVDLVVNITNGLQKWRTALYVASMDSHNVKLVFAFNKETGDLDIFWKHAPISESERQILTILREGGPCNISGLQQKYYMIMNKGNLSLVSKLVNRMEKRNLIKTERSGKKVLVRLTKVGLAYSKTKRIEEIDGLGMFKGDEE